MSSSALKPYLFSSSREWAPHAAFLLKTRREGRRYILNDRRFFRWQFHNPFWKSQRHDSFLRHQRSGRIIAELGFVPIPFRVFGRLWRTRYFMNLAALPRYEGKGIGAFLMRRGEAGADLGVILGYNNKAAPILQGFGWQMLPNLRRYVYVFHAGKARALARGLRVPISQPPRMPRIHPRFIFQEVRSLGTAYQRFWKRVQKKYPVSVDRSPTYLGWRYLRHPIFRYHLFLTESAQGVEAASVVRIERVGPYAIGRIVDFISTDRAEEFTAQNVLEFCRRQGTDLVDYFASGGFHNAAFRRAGFVLADREPHASLPILFNPVDHGKKAINTCFRIVNPGLSANRLYREQNWYLTKGDSDQDRPN